MKTIFTFLFAFSGFLLFSETKAQSYDWAKSIGGPLADISTGMATDASGNVYVTGYFQNTADFDPGASAANLTSAGSDDIFLAKYDSSGNYVWAKRLGSADQDWSSGLVLDPSGNIYITGFFGGVMTFDPSGVAPVIFPMGYWDGFVAKYDPNGNYIWTKQFGGTNGDVGGKCISLDDSGNVVVSGYFDAPIHFDFPFSSIALTKTGNDYDVFFAKYDSSGTPHWAKKISGTNVPEGVDAMSVDHSGNIFLTGQFVFPYVDFDPGTDTSYLPIFGGGYRDIYLAKYDSAGNYLWANALGSTGEDHSYDLFNDAAGNIFVTGSFSDSGHFNPAIPSSYLRSVGGEDVFLAKYDGSGNYLFALRLGSSSGDDHGKAIGADTSGNIFLSGTFIGTVDFDPGPGTTNLTSAGNKDIFFSEYDPSGNLMFARKVGGTGVDEVNVLNIDPSGNLLITGNYNATADFNPGPLVANLSPYGVIDIFIAKYIPCNFAVTAISNSPVCPGNELDLLTDSGQTYLWTGPGGFASTARYPGIIHAASSNTGTFSVTVTSSSGCMAHAQVPVIVFSVPTLVTSGNSPVCEGDTLFISASGALNYLWTGPNGFMQFGPDVSIPSCPVTASGSYVITFTDANGCSSNTIVSAVVDSLPLPDAGDDALICMGNSVMLDATGGVSFMWAPPTDLTDPSLQNPIASPLSTTTYTVTATDIHGCKGIDTITVNVSSCTGVETIGQPEHSISVFPNPVVDLFTVDVESAVLPEASREAQFEMYDALGRMVLRVDLSPGKKTGISRNDLPSGIYFWRVVSTDWNASGKIVLE